FTVQALDALGNVDPTYLGTVTFSSSDPNATLPASYTFIAADNGVHAFTATLKTAGTQTITATNNIDTTVTGTGTLTVNPAAASTLVVAGYPSPTVINDSHTFTVPAQDPFGNVATGYRGTVHFTSTNKPATLPADYTFTSADNGVHTFSATFR